MVTKITSPVTPLEVIDKINEIVDDKQDTLVSGTNIKTINNTSILGSGNIDIQGGGGSYTAGDGIDITNNVISVDGVTTSEVTLATVATSGDYDDLSNKPTIPTVNNATLTITQGGTSKGTFTANASSNVTIALDSGGTVDVDNSTITLNSSDEIQTVAVKDNRSGNAIKTWTGTKAQYDAIVTKDPNTLYNITDDTDVSLTILEALYPVGSVYITTASTCPLSTLISGSTWTLVSSGRVLQGADSNHSAGTTAEAGLPNITGNTSLFINDSMSAAGTGALRTSPSQYLTGDAGTGRCWQSITIDASRSSSIYGNSSTVQPPAYFVNIFRRVS
jgi:hypothetical protein